MLPYVIVHNSVSLDGRIDGFRIDIGLHYEVAGRLAARAHLSGSDTILANEKVAVPDGPSVLEPPPVLGPEDSRPILAVVDSRGLVRSWHVLRGTPYWKGFVSLASGSTPEAHLK